MNPEQKKNTKDFVRLANLSSVGIGLVAASLIGAGAGYLIDKHFHTTPIFTLILLFLGIIAGFLNIYRTVTRDSH
jgi:ATP synthase protein I